jgi:ATP-dependent exoDNAse (exonuclease V) alpha subunit
VVVGKAGTGKTHALAAAHQGWTAAGHRVIGAAVAARAAVALTDEAGIPAVSVTRLLAATERARARGMPGVIPAGGVLIVDEAGMLGTRQTARLLEATNLAGAKLVLVGDHRQLPELAAGGTFRALARELSAVRLTENHRQAHAWERDALDDLRHGDVDRALGSYDQQGRITITADATAQREELVGAWWDAFNHDTDRRDRQVGSAPVMLAARRADVEDLNRQARERMAGGGELRGPSLRVEITDRGHRDFQVGDLVIARRNDYLDGLVNGQRGVITHVDLDAGTLTISAGQRQVTVPPTYLRGGAIEYGYALTVHQAQGLTTDRTFLLGNSALYREVGYVGLSRARHRAELHLTSRPDQLDDHDSCHTERQGPEADVLDAAKRALTQSRAQRTAYELSR